MSIFSIPFLLTNQVYDHTGNPGKQNNIQKIEKKAFPSEHDFHRAQIGDLRSRPCNHKCRRAAHTHSFPQPLLQQRNCSASAHIQRNADGCRHQYAKAVILSEKIADEVRRYMDLIQCGQQDSEQKHGTCGFDIPADVLQKPDEHIGIRIAALSLMKPGEVEKGYPFFAIEQPDQPSGHTSAEKAADTADDHSRLPQRCAVEDQLGIQQNTAHHESCQVIIFNSLFRK